MRAKWDEQQNPVIWPLPGQKRANRQGPTAELHTGHTWLRRLQGLVIVLIVAVLIFLAGCGIAYWRLSATVTSYSGEHFNLHQNGVWLEHSWAGQAHSGAEYDALAEQLAAEQISYVYAHVGPLNADGTIPADIAPNAATLVAELHARLPHLHVLAWIGQVEAAGGGPGEVTVNLNYSQVRDAIAATAAHFVTDLGFDGVQYDIEPIINNNPRYIDLLDETRALLPAGAILSTIGQKWAPDARAADFLRSQGKADAWWTSYYYAAVAAHVDQIVPLIYNSAMPTGDAYEFFVQQETEHILDAVRSARYPPQVLIGVPTYTGDSFWFHDTAENISTSLTGIITGLNSNRNTAAFTGVSLYRFATTSSHDWSIYNSMWLGTT
ncbi:MAG: hypothetical protein ACLQUY_14625 [Ktedonobacterales bacterium]